MKTKTTIDPKVVKLHPDWNVTIKIGDQEVVMDWFHFYTICYLAKEEILRKEEDHADYEYLEAVNELMEMKLRDNQK